MSRKIGLTIGALFAIAFSQASMATCSDIMAVLNQGISSASSANADAGYPLKFWITAVDETGMVCAVRTNGIPGTYSGNSEWLGSRVISAQKANTANAFSLDGYAISTANLYSPVQPGGSLYGLQHSNPVDASRAYGGIPALYGTGLDYLTYKRIGGVNVFGGGLALYKNGRKVGAVGVSGDTSCADHVFAWEVRAGMGMEPQGQQTSALQGLAGSNGVGITTVNLDANGGLKSLSGAMQGDEMVITGSSGADPYWTAWAHPACPNTNHANAAVVVNGSW